MLNSLIDSIFSDEKKVFWISIGLLIPALLLFLGVQPLFLEEPRRAFIAMELIANDNWWVPTLLGEYYYKKPPFFNWILIGIHQLFGGWKEWALRLPTVFSLLGIIFLTYQIGKQYLPISAARLSALLTGTSSGFLFYFSTLAEIDLFYSFITYASLLLIFHYNQKEQYLYLFVFSYLIAAIGTLTKGIPSVVFQGVTLLVCFWLSKKWRPLFSLKHFIGILLYVLIVGGYLWKYHQFHDLQNLFATQWGESSERTLLEKGFFPLIEHFVMFPIETLKDTLPGAILVFYLFQRGIWKQLMDNSLVRFSSFVLVANVLIYWISPGARQRYIYMLYPFLHIIWTYAYHLSKDREIWQNKLVHNLAGYLLLVLAVAGIGINFIPDLQFLPYLIPVSIVFTLVFLFLFLAFRRFKYQAVSILIMATIIGRLLFDVTVLPQRAHQSNAQKDRDLAIEIAEIVKDQPLYLWQQIRVSYTSIFYLNKYLDQVLVRKYDKDPSVFFIAKTDQLEGTFQTIMEFEFKGGQYQLIRFVE